MTTLAERLELAIKGPPPKTKAGLARACGIKPPSVSEWFSGRTKSIDAVHIFPAARYLRVDPEWLATGKGKMKPGNLDINEDQNPLGINLGNFSMTKLEFIKEIEYLSDEEFKSQKGVFKAVVKSAKERVKQDD